MAREYTYSQGGAIALNTVLVGPIDADGMRGISLQVASMGTSGAIQVQQSNDGTTWSSTIMQATNATATATPAAVGMFWCNLVGRFLRIVMSTAATAGTTSLAIRLDKEEYSELPTGMAFMNVTSLPATPAGTNLIGKSICDMSATIANGPAFSVHRLVSAAASTNATSVKATAGRVLMIRGYNAKAAVCYLKLYNKASAPTVGTDIPFMTIPLKASDVFNIDFENFGLNFSTGIAYAITGAAADADTTALVAADVVGLGVVYI